MFIAFMIGLLVAALAASTPQPDRPAPASLSDVGAPTAEPGRPIPVVFGTVLVKSPNVVWYGDLGNSPVTTDSGK